MSKPKREKVTDLTAERARRGTLPWAFTVDLAASRFRMTIYRGAGPHDVLAIAVAAEKWSRALRDAAKAIRKHTADPRLGKQRMRLELVPPGESK